MQIAHLSISRSILTPLLVVSLLGIVHESICQEPEVRDLTGEEPTVETLIEALRPDATLDAGVRARGLSESAPRPACKLYLSTNQRGLSSTSVALSVLFATDSVDLTPAAESTLDTLGEALVSPDLGSLCIGIEGHTDSIGSETYNLGLSRRRAEQVKQYLLETFAIESDRLMISGHGESRPLTSNDDEEGRRRNRRVQVRAYGG